MRKLLRSTSFVLCSQFAFCMDTQKELSPRSKEFSPEAMQNFKFPEKKQSYQEYTKDKLRPYTDFPIHTVEDFKKTVWHIFNPHDLNQRTYVRLWERIALACRNKIHDERILREILFMALAPDERGHALSQDCAVECVNKIKNQETLTEALFIALEPDQERYARATPVAIACIETIENPETVNKALVEALKPSVLGDVRSSYCVVPCLKKIENENTARDILAIQTKDERNTSFPVVRGIVALRKKNRHIITDQELVYLYRTTKNQTLKDCIEHEVNNTRPHLGQEIRLNIANPGGQEALFAERVKFLDDFAAITKDPKWGSFYLKPEEAERYFTENTRYCEAFLLKETDFKHKTALLSLALFKGDKTVPTYYGAKPQKYKEITRIDDPTKSTGLQLLVMLMRICAHKKDALQDDMTWNLFKEQFHKHGLWNRFCSEAKDIFEKEGIQLRGNIADTINQGVEVRAFTRVLKTNLGLKTLHGVCKGLKERERGFMQDAYSPFIEVLFMLQRGHNEKLEDPKEENRPRCPVGIFDDLMREIVIASGHSTIAQHMQIEKCH